VKTQSKNRFVCATQIFDKLCGLREEKLSCQKFTLLCKMKKLRSLYWQGSESHNIYANYNKAIVKYQEVFNQIQNVQQDKRILQKDGEQLRLQNLTCLHTLLSNKKQIL
jgi:hypothetical protein